jgi:hypothetical protein
MPTERAAEWMILYVCPPGQAHEPAAILLVDHTSDELMVRTKTELNTDDEDVALVWSGVVEDLMERTGKSGARDFIDWLETTASHSFQLSERHAVNTTSLPGLLDQLYSNNITELHER